MTRTTTTTTTTVVDGMMMMMMIKDLTVMVGGSPHVRSKANETLEEVKRAEVMVNMTKQAAETAVMRAMEADQRAKNASVRMDQLIQVMVDSVVTFTLYRTNFRPAENGTVQHFRSVDREL